MAEIKYGLDKNSLNNTVVANKDKIKFRFKITKITPPAKQVDKQDDIEMDM